MKINRCFPMMLMIVFTCTAAFAKSDLADAVMKGDKQAVRLLLQQHADVNAPQADGATALHWAVRLDDPEAVDLLVRAGANVKAENRLGATPLFLACINGNARIIEKLLNAGADPNAPVLSQDETPLMLAARTGNADAVKVLLDHHTNVNAKESVRGTTALMWAAEQNHAAVIEMLITHGADPNMRSAIVPPPPRYSRETRAFGPQTAAALGANASGKPTGGLTALVFASREDARSAAKALVAGGAGVNLRTEDGNSPLLVAVMNGHYELASFLLDHGADPNLANDKGWTPLYWAAKNRNADEPESGNIPVWNRDPMNPLDFIQKLLEKGAAPNARIQAATVGRQYWLQDSGATALFRAAWSGDLAVVKLLLAHGADPSLTTADNTTPLMAAAGIGWTDSQTHEWSENETLEVLKMLLDSGADVNAANKEGRTALIGAAHKGSNAAVQFLISIGAKLDTRDSGTSFNAKVEGGMIALDWALGVQLSMASPVPHPETVKLIVKLMTEKGIAIPERLVPQIAMTK